MSIEYSNDHQPVRITEEGYSPFGESKDAFIPLVRNTSIEYDNGLVSKIDGPRDDVEDITTFSYDSLRRLEKIDLFGGLM